MYADTCVSGIAAEVARRVLVGSLRGYSRPSSIGCTGRAASDVRIDRVSPAASPPSPNVRIANGADRLPLQVTAGEDHRRLLDWRRHSRPPIRPRHRDVAPTRRRSERAEEVRVGGSQHVVDGDAGGRATRTG